MCHFLSQLQNLVCQYIKFKNKCIWQGNCSRIKIYANRTLEALFHDIWAPSFAVFLCGKIGRLKIIANQSDAFSF